MATRRTTEFLDGNGIPYEVISHAESFTAQEVAAAAHIPGRDVAKTVVVTIDGHLALAAVPADCEVDMELLRAAAGARYVALADEGDFAHRFEGCQVGAMPPLGVLFGMTTYVDAALASEPYIAFNAGSHTDVVAVRFADYRRAAHPKLAKIARRLEVGAGRGVPGMTRSAAAAAGPPIVQFA